MESIQSPLISIVTVTYENGGGLRRTLESVASQNGTGSDVEFVVIDGGSTDESLSILESSSGVTWRSGPDSGIYDAMNKGTNLATGTYVIYMNAGDTFATSTSVQTLIGELRSKDPLWLVCRALDESTGHLIDNVPHRWWDHAWGKQPHCHQATVFKRETVVGIGGYDLNCDFVSDFDLILRFGLLERPLEVDQILVHYEGAGRSRSRADEVPALLSAVRRSRMNITGPWMAFDAFLVFYQRTRRRFHRWRTIRGPK